MKLEWHQWVGGVAALLVVIFLGLTPYFFSSDTHLQAISAYKDGDFTKASKIWLDLAKKNDPTAQYSLGRMYELGVGVNQNYEKAVYWYERAVKRGNANAQGSLAVLLAMGQGIERNLVDSYVMSSLAAYGSDKWSIELREIALGNRDKVALRLNEEQRKLALAKLDEWRQFYKKLQ